MPRTRNLVFTSLFAALIIAGTYIRIPVGPVPIVLATVFVILAGLLLRLQWAIASVVLYLGMGAAGVPADLASEQALVALATRCSPSGFSHPVHPDPA